MKVWVGRDYSKIFSQLRELRRGDLLFSKSEIETLKKLKKDNTVKNRIGEKLFFLFYASFESLRLEPLK